MKRKLLLAALCVVGALGFKANAQESLDITDLYLTNPGFELGTTEGWTVGSSSDTGARSTTNATFQMSNSEGSYLFNTWWQGIPIVQTAKGLPAGSYTLSAVLASDGATVYLIAGENSDDYAYTETTDSKVGITVSKSFTLTEATDFKVGAIGGAAGTAGEHKDYTAEGYWWYKADNFKLVLNLQNGATIPDAIVEKLLASKPTGKMSASVESALNTAISTFQSNATMENYNAALAAMATARTSIASYATITAGSISTSELGNWAISTTSGALAVNTWSTEGSTDGSNMTTPFIQNWIAAGTPLGAGKLYYRLEGLNPGEKYSVSALVRVLDESGAPVSGATFYVNSETKDIAANGSACTNGIAGTMNLAAEVDENGVLEFGIESATTATFNWVSIKNVTIAEYAGIKVSGIELSQTSATLTIGDALTLTATVTPDNADDKTFTWSSSDETVAMVTAAGIVSALAAGTATITATANDGSGVSATCTVTVANAEVPQNWSSIAEGTFYIRNVATGQFLGQGNSWDTQASIIKHGKPITAELADGKYKLKGCVTSDTYMGIDGYMDKSDENQIASFTISETSEGSGIYTIDYNGSLATVNAGSTIVTYQNVATTNALAQWQFLSFDDMQKNLESTKDATFYVKGALAQRSASSNGAWISSDVTTGISGNLAASNAYICSESYHKDAFSYTQTTEVPNGTYIVSVQGFNSGSSEAYLIANDEKVLLRTQSSENHGMTCNSRTSAAKVFEAGYYRNEVEVTVNDRQLTLGITGSSANCWVAWNNFELYMTNYIPVTGITASIDKAEIEAGQTATITASADPSPASFDALTYTSSNENVAIVDENGVVTAVAQGEATITVAAEMENVSTTVGVTVTYTSATAQDYADLNAAIEAAEAKVIGFEDGEYAAYNNADALAALAAAKAIDQTVSNTQISVQTATANLTSAVWTVNEGAVNALANADFEGTYAPKANSGVSSDRAIYQPNGWEVDVTGGIDSNDMTILNSECLAANNFTSITALSTGGNNTYLYRGKWGNNTNIDIYQNVTLPAGTYSLTCDAWKSGLGGDGNIFVDSQTASLSGNETSWRTLNIQFTLSEEKTVKVGFHLKHNNDGSEKFLGFDNFELYKLDEATMTVKAGKYGTFVAPFQVEIPTGIVAYEVASVTDKDVKLVEINGSILAAQTPVILKNTTETDKTETFYGTSLADADTKDSNYLVGVYKAGVDIPEGSYVLQTDTKTNEQAFYVVGSGFTSTPNRCYLKASAGANVRSISFAGEATGIEAIGVLTSGNYDGIYTAGGAKVNSLQKGLNIVVKDGKSYKIFVK